MLDLNEYLSKYYKGSRNPSLEAMEYFMNKYNHFEKEMKFVHVAGTNGKGSCVEMMCNILEKQGYKVGKFLSPHLINYNERISINGKDIEDSEFKDIEDELNPLIDEYNACHEENPVTYFELITTVALLYYYRNNVDIVVLETGLGGLYDCTNVITKPIVSIISSIGYDHMQILGNTLEEIAFQKAGIIKQDSDTVIFNQEQNINDVFIKQCNEKNNKLHIINYDDITNYKYDENLQYFRFKDKYDVAVNLKGEAQIRNASLCIEAVEILKRAGFNISNESIYNGLSTVVHRGRMEVLRKDPLIIFDGAHNEPAINNLLNIVDMYYKKHERNYIISVLSRKDYDSMLKVLSKDKQAKFILTGGNDPERYTSKEELSITASKYIEEDRIIKMDLEKAIDFALNQNGKTVNFIIGSFYTYETVKNAITK